MKPERKRSHERGDPVYQGEPCPHGHDGVRYTKTGACKECQRLKLERWREKKRREKWPNGFKAWKKCPQGYKVCTGCQSTLPHSSYSPDKRASDGLQPKCKECCTKAHKARYWADPETARAKQRDYHARNPHITKEINRRQREGPNREKILERKREDYRRNRDNSQWQERQHTYRQLTKEQKRSYDKMYRAQNRERLNEKARAWIKANPEKRRAICFNDAAKRRARKRGGPSAAEVAEWAMAQTKRCYWCGDKCDTGYHVDHYVPLSKGGSHSLDNLVIACASCNLRKNAKDPYEFAQQVGRLF